MDLKANIFLDLFKCSHTLAKTTVLSYIFKKRGAYNHSSLNATKPHTDQSQELAVKEESRMVNSPS